MSVAAALCDGIQVPGRERVCLSLRIPLVLVAAANCRAAELREHARPPRPTAVRHPIAQLACGPLFAPGVCSNDPHSSGTTVPTTITPPRQVVGNRASAAALGSRLALDSSIAALRRIAVESSCVAPASAPAERDSDDGPSRMPEFDTDLVAAHLPTFLLQLEQPPAENAQQGARRVLLHLTPTRGGDSGVVEGRYLPKCGRFEG